MKQVKCPKPMFANEEVAIFPREEIEDFLRYASDLETVALVFTSNMSMAIAAGKREEEEKEKAKSRPKPLTLSEVLCLPYGTRLWFQPISEKCRGKAGWAIFSLREELCYGEPSRFIPALEFPDRIGAWIDLSYPGNFLNKHYEVYMEQPEE